MLTHIVFEFLIDLINSLNQGQCSRKSASISAATKPASKHVSIGISTSNPPISSPSLYGLSYTATLDGAQFRGRLHDNENGQKLSFHCMCTDRSHESGAQSARICKFLKPGSGVKVLKTFSYLSQELALSGKTVTAHAQYSFG